MQDHFASAIYNPSDFKSSSVEPLSAWLKRYSSRIDECSLDADTREARMNQVNPLYVLRNYIAQLAIDEAEKGNNDRISETLEVLRNPYEEQANKEEFAARRPEWARERAGCSMLSCSS